MAIIGKLATLVLDLHVSFLDGDGSTLASMVAEPLARDGHCHKFLIFGDSLINFAAASL